MYLLEVFIPEPKQRDLPPENHIEHAYPVKLIQDQGDLSENATDDVIS